MVKNINKLEDKRNSNCLLTNFFFIKKIDTACSNTSDGDVVDDPSISNSSSYNEDKDSDISLSVLSISSQPSPVSKLKLPKSFKMTAPQVNEISHTRKRMRRRENRLKNKGNIDVKAALIGISEQEHVLKTAQNMEEIDSVHRYHLSERDKLRAFEFSRNSLKDRHNQHLRTERAWAILASEERKHVKDHLRSSRKDETRK